MLMAKDLNPISGRSHGVSREEGSVANAGPDRLQKGQWADFSFSASRMVSWDALQPRGWRGPTGPVAEELELAGPLVFGLDRRKVLPEVASWWQDRYRGLACPDLNDRLLSPTERIL